MSRQFSLFLNVKDIGGKTKAGGGDGGGGGKCGVMLVEFHLHPLLCFL